MELKSLSKLTLEKDEDFVIEVVIRDPSSGQPIDISDATFTSAFNTKLDDPQGGQQMTIQQNGSGSILVSIPRATVNSLQSKATYFFNVFMLIDSIQYKILGGSFTVSSRAMAP